MWEERCPVWLYQPSQVFTPGTPVSSCSNTGTMGGTLTGPLERTAKVDDSVRVIKYKDTNITCRESPLDCLVSLQQSPVSPDRRCAQLHRIHHVLPCWFTTALLPSHVLSRRCWTSPHGHQGTHKFHQERTSLDLDASCPDRILPCRTICPAWGYDQGKRSL